MSAFNTVSDNNLAELLRQGDINAFTAIYNRYWKKIYGVASNCLSVGGEAEEIVQNIFLNLWGRRDTFRLVTGFDNYFAVAVKFEILDIIRKHAYCTAYKEELGISFSEIDESPLRDLDLVEFQEKFQSAINSLPEKCQLVFRLKHKEGYSQEKIAEELSISEKTVEAYLSRTRKTFHNTFGPVLEAVIWINF
ncbi:MAG TPA: sigma-70 family RNA polymerase sigma factor [Pedobacter sp.]